MFTICRGQRFRCWVSSVVSLYLFLNTFVYATEIFPRVFCHGDTRSDIHTPHLQDGGMAVDASEQPVSGSQYQPTAKCSHDDYCPDCKSSYGHHLMALSPLPITGLPEQAWRKIETAIFMFSEYRDSLTPPPPKPLL